MPSSFKVIKNESVQHQGEQKIKTIFSGANRSQLDINEKTAREYMDSYESIAKGIVENARIQSEEIIIKAYKEREEIERIAIEKNKNAYEKGYKDGFDKAYNDGYEKNILKAKSDGELLKKNAEKTLYNAQEEYIRYLDEKEDEIKDLIYKISESILKKEIKYKDAVNEMIFDAISHEKNKKTFIIKCNSIYTDNIKDSINEWKDKLIIKEDVFVIGDEDIEEGHVIIEKEDGRIIMSLQESLEKIKQILCSE